MRLTHITIKLCYNQCMSKPDLNLLITLDVLLAEGSVARAAQRLQLSPSAMSRALARLRATTGDPLLVRAGRGLVPTPRALELRERVSQLVQDSEAVLRPAEKPDLTMLVRTFTLRTSEGFVKNFGPDLIARVGEEAPGVRLRFVSSQTALGWKTGNGLPVFRWDLYPTAESLRDARKPPSQISYYMNHPTFNVKLLSAGAGTGFRASYNGWGCLSVVYVLIEYMDPDTPPSLTHFDQCGSMQ